MIRIAIASEECTPFKQHKWDAGWDLKSNSPDFTLAPGDKVKIPTGVKLEIPVRHAGMVVPRSGLGSKYEVGLANTVGIIDSDYRGEIFVNFVNKGTEPVEIKQFDRFAQLIIFPIYISNLRVLIIRYPKRYLSFIYEIPGAVKTLHQ